MVFEPRTSTRRTSSQLPPYNLDRRFPSERPLAVFFEQGDCHACDVLHGQALREPAIYRLFEEFDNVQLDMWSDTPVVTPSGERTTAREWAETWGSSTPPRSCSSTSGAGDPAGGLGGALLPPAQRAQLRFQQGLPHRELPELAGDAEFLTARAAGRGT
jgi:hypothetical protein